MKELKTLSIFMVLLAFTVFCGCSIDPYRVKETTIPIPIPEDRVLKDGFKNIKLGMTKFEVQETIIKDGTYSEPHPIIFEVVNHELRSTKIGEISVWTSYSYDNHGLLYQLIIIPYPSCNASEIDPFVSKRITYFYDILKTKYGETPLIFPKPIKEINIFDFKDSYYSAIYSWTNKGVERRIVLSTEDYRYNANIIITDIELLNKKQKEDKEKENNIKNKAVKDF